MKVQENRAWYDAATAGHFFSKLGKFVTYTNKVKHVPNFYHRENQKDVWFNNYQTILITMSCFYGNSVVAMELFKRRERLLLDFILM